MDKFIKRKQKQKIYERPNQTHITNYKENLQTKTKQV